MTFTASDPYAAMGTVEAPKAPDPRAAPGAQAGAAPWTDYEPASAPKATQTTAGPWDDYAAMGTVEKSAPMLHTWQLTKPDGSKAQFQLPEDTPDEVVRQHAAQIVGDADHSRTYVLNRTGAPPPPEDHSAATGFLAGVMKPIDNLSTWLDKVPGLHDVSDWIAHQTGLPTTNQAVATNEAIRSGNDRTGYQTAGKILGTLPTVELPGGAFVQAGASGALTSDQHSLPGLAIDTGIASLTGGIASHALAGIAGTVGPHISPYVKQLTDLGVRPTVGQIARAGGGFAGRMVSNIEDRASALPIVGEGIDAARDAANLQFRRGAVQQALNPIGVDLPAHLETGHGMVHFAQRQVSRAYDAALSRMRMIPDQQLSDDLTSLDQRIQNGGLSQKFQKRLQAEVHGNVARRIYGNGSGMLDGGELQTTLSSLRQKAGRFGSSQDAEQQEYGDVLAELADHIESAATRSSPPDAVAARNAANTAYANLVRVEGAAKSALAGDFSPSQLDVSVRNAASLVRGRDASAGKALMQDYSTAARKVLPSQTGSSGTAERLNTFNPFKWGVGLAMAPGQLIANHIVAPALSRVPSAAANRTADLLRSLAPAAGLIAAPVSIQATHP